MNFEGYWTLILLKHRSAYNLAYFCPFFEISHFERLFSENECERKLQKYLQPSTIKSFYI